MLIDETWNLEFNLEFIMGQIIYMIYFDRINIHTYINTEKAYTDTKPLCYSPPSPPSMKLTLSW